MTAQPGPMAVDGSAPHGGEFFQHVRIAGHDCVADAKRAAVHEHRRDRAAADVEA